MPLTSPAIFSATVRPTPGISCERPIRSTLVCFIPLLGVLVTRETEVTLQVQGSVEDTEDVDVLVGTTLINDAITPVQQDPNTGVLLGLVLVADVRKRERQVGLLEDTVDHLVCCARTVATDVGVDLP